MGTAFRATSYKGAVVTISPPPQENYRLASLTTGKTFYSPALEKVELQGRTLYYVSGRLGKVDTPTCQGYYQQ